MNKGLIAGFIALVGTGMILLTSCQPQESHAYKPGLGEIMGYLQIRHAKLWFAGDKENWQLADYGLHELEEGVEDITKLHPTHDRVPMPTEKAVQQFMNLPLQQLRDAITQKNKATFSAAFESLTASCNACHMQSNVAFIRVQQPELHPYSNQDFAYKP
ncbi:MAG: hypothetical protein FJ147_16270 [Deltaproteobacteria bacterium]|nr:hypothetical protein [Deltaproteobacteria bacterium]